VKPLIVSRNTAHPASGPPDRRSGPRWAPITREPTLLRRRRSRGQTSEAGRAGRRSRPNAPSFVAAVQAARRASARVARVRALAGGTASAVNAVEVVDRAGTLHPLVLRRYVRGEGPEAPRREAAALEATAALAVPTPRLVAVGSDAVLMTRMEGALDWERPSLRRLAAVLPAIHAADAPEGLPPYAPTRSLQSTRRRRPSRAPSPSSTARRRAPSGASSTATTTRATCSGAPARSAGSSTRPARASALPPPTSATAA
jgi:hypothetical protein